MRPYRILGFVVVVLASACGGGQPEAKTPAAVEAPKEAPRARGPAPVVSQELGEIDPREVEKTFAKLQGAFERCHSEGRGRVEYMSGDVKIFLRVDAAGKAKLAYLEDTTLGDRPTEKCIVDTVLRTTWPTPRGGEAEVRTSFGWSPGGERAPSTWSADKVSTALAGSKDVGAALSACGAGPGSGFKITAYVEPDPSGEAGTFQSLGVVPPNKEAASKVDCVVDALRGLKLPSPGSYAAKVQFSL